MWLAIRETRTKERKVMEKELSEERQARLECEQHAYRLSLKLAEHGIDPS